MGCLAPISGVSGWISRLLLVLLGWPVFSCLCHAIALQARETNSSLLRVMPLGASITDGYRSTDGNGYRNWVREQLVYEGWEVDMVGSRRSGMMKDNDNEGHYGYRVDEVASVVEEKSLDLQPNLILINAGTNDAIRNYNVDTVGERMNALITRLFDATPDTTIILSTLLPNKLAQSNINKINPQYREIAGKRRADGDRVVLADMSSFITVGELVDDTHPSDDGYKRMASVWWAAIKVAEFEGMLHRPAAASRAAIQNETDSSAAAPNLPQYTAGPQPVSNSGFHGCGKDMHVSAMLVFSLFLGGIL